MTKGNVVWAVWAKIEALDPDFVWRQYDALVGDYKESAGAESSSLSYLWGLFVGDAVPEEVLEGACSPRYFARHKHQAWDTVQRRFFRWAVDRSPQELLALRLRIAAQEKKLADLEASLWDDLVSNCGD